MTLQVADFPGSHATGERVDTGATGSGYERVIRFASPYGTSKYKAVASIALSTPDAPTADQAYRILAHRFSTKQYRAQLLKEFVPLPKAVIAKIGSEKMIKPRALGVHDSSMEIGFVVKLGNNHLNVSVTLLRVESAIVLDIATGEGALVAIQDGQAFVTLARRTSPPRSCRSGSPHRRSPAPRRRGRRSPRRPAPGTARRRLSPTSGSAATPRRELRRHRGRDRRDVPGRRRRRRRDATRERHRNGPLRLCHGFQPRHGRRDLTGLQSGNETYGGAMASTWSVLRMSCKPRSPVGLVNPPGNNASAENNLALAA
jgi:hypothetical protein